jgi:hypothetical protein
MINNTLSLKKCAKKWGTKIQLSIPSVYHFSLCRPIHDAIEIGCLDLVKLLIDHKADLMVEYGERTAVEFAMDQNQLEIAEYIKGEGKATACVSYTGLHAICMC